MALPMDDWTSLDVLTWETSMPCPSVEPAEAGEFG